MKSLLQVKSKMATSTHDAQLVSDVALEFTKLLLLNVTRDVNKFK